MPSAKIPVSIHPYFKVHPGQMTAVQALLREFVARTATEPGVLFYEFTIADDVVFCREAYRDAEALLAHLANVGAQVEKMLTLSDLARIEVHGPAAELAKLHGPLAGMKPAWFAFECGIER